MSNESSPVPPAVISGGTSSDEPVSYGGPVTAAGMGGTSGDLQLIQNGGSAKSTSVPPADESDEQYKPAERRRAARPVSFLEWNSRPRFEQPDWRRWAMLDIAPLWEAACLAVGFEPPKVGGRGIWNEGQLQDFPDEFRVMWEIVNRDAVIARILAESSWSGRMHVSVLIDDFAHWAAGKGLALPEPMQERAARFSAQLERPQSTVITLSATRQQTVSPSPGIVTDVIADTAVNRSAPQKSPSLTAKQRADIVRRKAAGESAESLALEFGKSKRTIYKIVADAEDAARPPSSPWYRTDKV